MARARIGSSVKTKLNMLLYGDTASGKSTMAMQIAYFKREDGTPFRVLVLDAESGGCEEILDELAANGVDIGNIYLVYTQSQKEIKDYSQLNFAGQDLVLSLMACGVHVIMTAREKAETIQVKGDDGKTYSVNTGKMIYDSFKGMDYNTKTLIRMCRDESSQVCAEIVKDRTKVHQVGDIIEDPTLLDWQAVIEKGKDRKEFVLKNDLDNAVETDQKIFEKQMLGKEIETEQNTQDQNKVADVKAEITAKIKAMTPPEKAEMKKKLTEAGLPISYNKIEDISVLNKVLEIVNA